MSKLSNLQEQISLFDFAYEQGHPLISDTEYEKKYSELKKLEKKEGQLPTSPTNNIVYLKIDGLETVKHLKPILSLEKVNSSSELRNWFPYSDDILIQPKLDGLTVVLKYQDGKLIDAVTRGNGYEGDRIIHTIRTVQNLPQEINYEDELVLRGEVYISFPNFEEVNNGEYANPRSMVAGTVRLLDANEAAKRKMSVCIFDLISSKEKFETDIEQIGFLQELGFPVVETKLKNNFEKIIGYCNHYEREVRKTLVYPIDGLVLKYNSLSLREQLGYTAKAPKYAVSYKFASLEEFTTLRDVIWQVGKNGQITPVAIYDTITIDNVDLSRATLHNFQFIKDQNLQIGSRIVVTRANDVIPKVVKAVTEGTEPILLPKSCPECNAEVELQGANAYCLNKECPAQLIEKIIHFCSRDAMNIEGMGEVNVKTFFKQGYIKTPADLYTLHTKAKEIKQLEGYGEKKVRTILDGIEKSKEVPFENVLYALNIPHLGRSNSKTLAKEFGNIDTIISLDIDQLTQVEGVGNVMAQVITDFFLENKNIEMVNNLKEFGVQMANPVKEEAITQNSILQDKVIVISGTLKEKRSYYEKFITANGGKVTGSVSKKTKFLILGPDKAGSGKHKKAQELGIPVITESEFWDYVGGVDIG